MFRLDFTAYENRGARVAVGWACSGSDDAALDDLEFNLEDQINNKQKSLSPRIRRWSKGLFLDIYMLSRGGGEAWLERLDQ